MTEEDEHYLTASGRELTRRKLGYKAMHGYVVERGGELDVDGERIRPAGTETGKGTRGADEPKTNSHEDQKN